MKFGYIRISTKEQSEARQVDALKQYVELENISIDKASGKDFNREQYQLLKHKMRKGDELYIKELDRLGRNKDQIKQELQWFKEQGIRIKILDIPTSLMDIGEGQEWLVDMINNILIEVLGTIAEQERIKIKTRQAEGIEAMEVNAEGVKVSSKKGKGKYGRPKKPLPKGFKKYYEKVLNGEITNVEAMKLLEVKKTRYYELVKMYKEQEGI